MTQSAFKYNPDAGYFHSSHFNKKAIDIIQQDIVITSDGKSFKASLPDVFENYKLPHVTSDALVQEWRTNWLNFWQNQLNFAIWCATTGCGVDFKNHLQASGMTGSLFRFHVYYQTRRILFEMGCALPQDASWNAFDNSYDRGAYEKICKEFNVITNADWRQKQSINDGLGNMHSYYLGPNQSGFMPGAVYHKKDFTFSGTSASDKAKAIRDITAESFIDVVNATFSIDYMYQGPESDNAWTTFILDNTKGFTRAGVERINDSIRTFCWAILGSQSQTRTDIIGTGTSFDAQKEFLANIEDAINSPVDLPSQIARYQNTLKYARSKVDYVFGIGLYMAPNDMELQIGSIQNYNNEILIAPPDLELGVNNIVNDRPVPPPKEIHKVQGIKTKPPAVQASVIKPSVVKLEPTTKKIAEEHESKKTAFIVGSIAVGLGVIVYYESMS